MVKAKTNEQLDVIEQSKKSLNRIAYIIEMNTASTQEIAVASEELSQLANSLDNSINFFKIK